MVWSAAFKVGAKTKKIAGVPMDWTDPARKELDQIVARAERERADGEYADYDAVSRELREKYGLAYMPIRPGASTKGAPGENDALNR